jgi:hypothetical protein
MGLFTGQGLKIFKGPIWERTWRRRSESELVALHDDLVKDFTNLPHGPFRAVKRLVGHLGAVSLGQEGELQLPDCYTHNSGGAGPSRVSGQPSTKRQHESSSDEESSSSKEIRFVQIKKRR